MINDCGCSGEFVYKAEKCLDSAHKYDKDVRRICLICNTVVSSKDLNETDETALRKEALLSVLLESSKKFVDAVVENFIDLVLSGEIDLFKGDLHAEIWKRQTTTIPTNESQ